MLKIMRGIIILVGILLIFLLLTACSSNDAFTRKDKISQSTRNYDDMSERDEHIYNRSDNTEFRYEDKERNNRNENLYSRDRINKDRDNNYNDDLTDNEQYYQKGYASWYGREFHGRKTASGERFDMNRLTAAHKKLPFGTQVLVKNLENGNNVKVIINDRGPYRDGRILDLSYAAAKKLGILASGEAKVGIKILRKGDEENFVDNTSEPIVGVSYKEEDLNAKDDYIEESYNKGNYSVQAGAFYSRRNAERFQKRLEGLMDNPITLIHENDMYKVRIEKLTSKYDANRIKRLLEAEDISSFIMENRD